MHHKGREHEGSINWTNLQRYGQNLRVHGNGFVQIDVPELDDLRIHIFGHPAVPRQTRPTPIHDHRFAFHSVILHGALVNVFWREIMKGTNGIIAPKTHETCVYKRAEGTEDTKLRRTGRLVALAPSQATSRVLTKGAGYHCSIGQLHETFANEPTITMMRKTKVDPGYQPRVMCRIGTEPDNAFHRDQALNQDQLWDVVRDTLRLAGRA